MQKRQHLAPGIDNDQNFWEGIWSAYSQRTATRDSVGQGAIATATATNVDATVWSTAYVTIYLPTTTQWITSATVPPGTTSSKSSSHRHSTLTVSGNSSEPANSTISKSPTTWVVPSSTVASSSGPSTNSTFPSNGNNAVLNAEPTSNATMGGIAEAMPTGRKRAIIGGLSGTIAGLVLIGLIIFLVLRRRRKQQEARDIDEDYMSEKGVHSPPVHRWAGFAAATPIGRGSPRDSHNYPASTSQIAVDEDHRIIRMSTRHWSRPYAVGEGEGYREAVPSGQLRVVNPDTTRPSTPRRPSTDTVGSYFRKQQSAFAGFVFSLPRSARQSRTEQTSRAQETPTIAIVDPSLSRECVLGSTGTPSFRSYPSMVSLPTIRQQPPEDVFLATLPEAESPVEDTSLPPEPGTRRPSLAPLQNVAGSASRTLSHFGHSLLQPFRPKSSNAATPQQKQAHLSSSTYSSRMSRRSDPFDLDRPSIRGSNHIAGVPLYEGT